MLTKLMIGLVVFSILGGTASGMSLLPKFGNKSVRVVPIKETKKERTIRCKGDIKLSKNGEIIGCTEGFRLDESSENKEERKANMKERFLGWLGNFKGMFFWLVVGSIAASFLGFGGIVGTLWTNLFGTATRALKATVRAIARAKRRGGKYMEELDRAHSSDKKVQKKINELRAKNDT